jgi:hypothetical protein
LENAPQVSIRFIVWPCGGHGLDLAVGLDISQIARTPHSACRQFGNHYPGTASEMFFYTAVSANRKRFETLTIPMPSARAIDGD